MKVHDDLHLIDLASFNQSATYTKGLLEFQASNVPLRTTWMELFPSTVPFPDTMTSYSCLFTNDPTMSAKTAIVP